MEMAIGDLKVLHLDGGQLAGVAAGPPCLGGALIGGEVKGDEEEEVGAQDAHAGESSKFLASAAARVRHPLEVGAGEVGVGGEVDEAEVDDELQDLEHGDVFFPPDADAARGLEVVPIHDHVDHEVEGDGDPGDGGEADELGVA